MADSFIEDFMGELNQKSSQQFIQDPTLEWQGNFAEIENNSFVKSELNNLEFHNQLQLEETNNNLQFQMNVLPCQSFENTQQIIEQSVGFKNYVPDLNIVQNLQPHQSLNNFQHFTQTEAAVIMAGNDVISNGSHINVKRGLNDILKSDENIGLNKTAKVMNVINFENDNNNVKTANKKQKSRSINAIINENNNSTDLNSNLGQIKRQTVVNSPIYITNNNANFILDQNIVIKSYKKLVYSKILTLFP